MQIGKVLGIDVNNVETKTIAQIDQLVASSSLSPLTTYEITGVDPTLYGGTTIYLQAVSNNTLNERGIGKFYNPKYGDYPIWRVDLPGSPPFGQGEAVIWGGRVWINNGNDAGGPGGPGEVIDIFTLGGVDISSGYPIWSVEDYNSPTSEFYYNIAYDEIVYSYPDDKIVYRNEENTNIVSISAEYAAMVYPSIKAFQWGNTYRYDGTLDLFKGIGNQHIQESYNENINFNGEYQYGISMKNSIQILITNDTTKSQHNLSFDNSQQLFLTLDYTQSEIIFDNYGIDRTSIGMVGDEENLHFQGSSIVTMGQNVQPETSKLLVNGNISVNNWYGTGSTGAGLNVSLSNLASAYQIGVIVEIPHQTQVNPPGIASPDAFVARIKGQSPGSLPGSVAGFVAEVDGIDNMAFIADMTTGASASMSFVSRSFDAHTGTHFVAQRYVASVATDVFKVANNGDVTANKFIKTGGTNTQYLMADGSTSSGGGGGGSGTVSGTTNYVAKFTGSTAVGDSSIFDNGIGVGIGLTSVGTTYRLLVNGSGFFNDTVFVANGGSMKFSQNSIFIKPELISGGYKDLAFYTNTSERMRITDAGNLLIGLTSSISGLYKLHVNGDIKANNITANYYGLPDVNGSTTGIGSSSDRTLQLVIGGGTAVNIATNNNATFSASVTATGFFNSSDARSKDVIEREGDTVKFTWKDQRDDKVHIGYIAQEVQEKYPDQVNENEDGMLTVNYIEVLVAKIQELENRIKQLEK